MLLFSSCPKCKKGAIQAASDIHGGFMRCVNCALRIDLDFDPTGMTGREVMARLADGASRRGNATQAPSVGSRSAA